MRYAAKVDVKHGEIRDGLRACGVFVLDLSRAGKGCPDLLCHTSYTGWVPIEVKSERKIAKRKKGQPLTEAQQGIHQQAPIAVVETLQAALLVFGIAYDPTWSSLTIGAR